MDSFRSSPFQQFQKIAVHPADYICPHLEFSVGNIEVGTDNPFKNVVSPFHIDKEIVIREKEPPYIVITDDTFDPIQNGFSFHSPPFSFVKDRLPAKGATECAPSTGIEANMVDTEKTPAAG